MQVDRVRIFLAGVICNNLILSILPIPDLLSRMLRCTVDDGGKFMSTSNRAMQ